MAVYTKIISKDIHLINSKFNIDEIKSFQGIKKGIENTNYLLKTKKEKFILTIFEKRVSNKEIPFFMKLMDNLNQSKISCPKPLKDRNGNYLIKLKNKTACVVTFLKGKDKQTLNLNNCYQVGKIISQMHSITKKLKFSRKNSMGIKKLNPLLKSIKFKSKKNSNLEKFLMQNLSNIKKNWPEKLPYGIIHGDLFVDNIFFNKDKLSGVIDFYFAANDFFMYEIAICINALCFDKKKNKFLINKQKVKNLIKGYESVRKITIGEKKSLNILCRGAAIRYLLTRLYDYSNTPKTALIQIKDPNEYYQKLITHNNLSSYRDYLF
ncbi:homoserine kinase [Candidatus Pelagibacter sp. HTCC7211]|uniref:homoserine kinase n=1 Tax=Pelagibacter sp. (strain HTCC7211) TaxID=439493 RepID=UPI000183B728|nr:homoserine kinase [Candidatus Pelagibacter sp. HTCC7211]EDZ60544.1 homoserine kinase [Candidatus Pelagibacter sp. HTCC7211]